MIELIVREGKKADKEVCLCGEIASFGAYYPFFLALGLQSFSVSVAMFSDIKCELLQTREKRDTHIVSGFYASRNKQEAERYLAKLQH
jgi:phosphoenolpyruvate-protein kinase (PTS system EI component)